MNKPQLLTGLLLFLIVIAPVNAEQLVERVDKVHYRITKTVPPQLHVVAQGMVPTGGWGFPRLVPRPYWRLPANGILEYDFYAREPASDRMVIQIESPIGASNPYQDYYPDIKGIKVNGKSNSQTMMITPPDPDKEK